MDGNITPKKLLSYFLILLFGAMTGGFLVNHHYSEKLKLVKLGFGVKYDAISPDGGINWFIKDYDKGLVSKVKTIKGLSKGGEISAVISAMPKTFSSLDRFE